MDGTLVVLRSDLVVFVPAAPVSPAAAREFAAAWDDATEGGCRVVVLESPVRVVDVRDADPELVELAERIASRIHDAVVA